MKIGSDTFSEEVSQCMKRAMRAGVILSLESEKTIKAKYLLANSKTDSRYWLRKICG